MKQKKKINTDLIKLVLRMPFFNGEKILGYVKEEIIYSWSKGFKSDYSHLKDEDERAN